MVDANAWRRAVVPLLVVVLAACSSAPTGSSAEPLVTPSGTAGGSVAGVTQDSAPSMASSSLGPSSAETPAIIAGVRHVFLLVMENQDYTRIYDTSRTEYTTLLADSFARAANYDAIEHPSLGNYLDLIGGTSAGTSGDCSPSDSCHVSSPALVDLLETAGLTWKGYFEAMGTPCRLTDAETEDYEAHHNPFIYFDSIRNDPQRCAQHDVDYGALAGDLAGATTTPNFALVVPSGPNHNGSHSIPDGDAWLSGAVPALLNAPACTQEACLVIVTWDEDDYHGRNQVLTIFAGSAARRGFASDTHYTHFALLRTLEAIYGVGTLTANDAAAGPMTELLLPGALR